MSTAEQTRRGAAEEAERSFQWFTPAKRRPSLYEDVTIDTQPAVGRHLVRGWPLWFEDGRSTWDESSTRLRCGDWYGFRDPGQMWERPFYQQGAALEREIENAFRAGMSDRLFDHLEPGWVQWLRDGLQVGAFIEHGLWQATAAAARDCLSDSIATCVVLEASMKQRLAQAIVLYAMDLEAVLGELPVETAKRRLLEDRAWAPARSYIERLWALRDWGETIVAANLVFEPLVGVLLRRELGIRAATAGGDAVTPVVARSGQLEWEWIRGWSAGLARFLLADERHGAHNREVLDGWLADWLPAAQESAAAIVPLAAALPGMDSAEEILGRLERDRSELLAEAGLADD